MLLQFLVVSQSKLFFGKMFLLGNEKRKNQNTFLKRSIGALMSHLGDRKNNIVCYNFVINGTYISYHTYKTEK